MALSRNASEYRSRDRPRSHASISITSAASCQLGEEFRSFSQVGGVEALGEPAADRREQLAGLGEAALITAQPARSVAARSSSDRAFWLCATASDSSSSFCALVNMPDPP